MFCRKVGGASIKRKDNMVRSIQPVFNVAVLGPSGVGKSPLNALFKERATQIEPYRGRQCPRDPGDIYYMAPEVLNALHDFCCQLGKPLAVIDSKASRYVEPYRDGTRKLIEVFEEATFFTVRSEEANQVLLHIRSSPTCAARKLEIYPPVLHFFMSESASRFAPWYFKDAQRTFVILLNPLEISYAEANEHKILKQFKWGDLQTQRASKRGQHVSAKVVKGRVRSIIDELAVYKVILKLPAPCRPVEVCGWRVFEHTYLAPNTSKAEQVRPKFGLHL